MSEMRKRVAAAIRNCGDVFPLGDERSYLSDEEAEVLAKAAILAMREPTDAMQQAADAADPLNWSLEPGEGLDGVSWGKAWRAMIDEVLK